jgi:hypothetical protein
MKRQKNVKGQLVLSFADRAYRSALVFFLWTFIAALAIYVILGTHKWGNWKYTGVLLPLLYGVWRWKHILWDASMAKTSLNLLLGTITKTTKVDDNLYLGSMPLNEDGDGMLYGKKLGINAVVSVLEPYQQTVATLSGRPMSAEDWHLIGIDASHRLILDKCKDGDPFSLSLADLHRAADFLDRHLSENNKVFVHCRHGGGHSASIVLAYFIKHKKWGLREAYTELKRTRHALDFGLQSPQTALLSKLQASARSGTNDSDKVRGSGMHRSVSKGDRAM